MDVYDAVVRVFDPSVEVAAALKELQRSGFDMGNISIVGKDYHVKNRIIANYHGGDRLRLWCQLGDFWGGLAGLLFGSAFYFIPGIGPVIVFGPLVSAILRTFEDAAMAGELSALGAGLHSVGIPKNSIMEYEAAVKCDRFIVIAHGSSDSLAKARSSLDSPNAAQIAAARRDTPRRARVRSRIVTEVS